jgi:hypothetical protein
LTVPICLSVQVEKMTLRGTLLAPVAIKEAPLRIERSDRENERIVAVWRGNELVSRDRYAIHHPG